MKELVYVDGPQRLNMGAAGQFIRGTARPVKDDLAKGLLAKKTIRFYQKGKVPAEAMTQLKNLETAEKSAGQPQQKEA